MEKEFSELSAQRVGISADPVDRQKAFDDKKLKAAARKAKIEKDFKIPKKPTTAQKKEIITAVVKELCASNQ